MIEQTLVIIKPDGVVRSLTGEILSRFEKTGLKLVAMKMLHAPSDLAEDHYPHDRESLWEGVGNKTLSNYKDLEIDAIKEMGTDDPKVIGYKIREWLMNYLKEGPVVAFVLEGPHAVEIVRKLTGHTMPMNAAPGTIRGDFGYDSPAIANTSARPVRNLVHASGTAEEAKYEVSLWFKPDEITKYERSDRNAMEGIK